MFKKLLQRFVRACVIEELNKIDLVNSVENFVDKRTQSYLDKHITDVNDSKSDYLKAYLEVRMNNNELSISNLITTSSDNKYEISKIKDRLEILEGMHFVLASEHELKPSDT